MAQSRDRVDPTIGSSRRRQNDAETAQRNLNTLFPNGIAVEKDQDAAVGWLLKAGSSGKAEAQNILGEMCRRGSA